MKKNKLSPLLKDTLRTIKSTFTRYLAIVLMTALGAAVFIGLKTTSPNMRASLEEKAKSHNMFDIKIFSYTGIRKEDIAIIDKIEGLLDKEYVFAKYFNIENSNSNLLLYSKTSDINTFRPLEGILPKQDDEIALDKYAKDKYGIKIGDKISLKNKQDPLSKENILQKTTFKVVGFVDSIDYISRERHKDGFEAIDADYYGVVSKEVFKVENPDYALLKLKDLESSPLNSPDYKKKEVLADKKIEELFAHRPDEVKKELQEQIKKDISKGEKEIKDAEDKLKKAREDLDKAKKELNEGWASYSKNITLFNEQISSAEDKISESEKKLVQSKGTLQKGIEDYNKNLKQYIDKTNEAKTELDKNKDVLDKAKKELEQKENLYNTGLSAYLDGLEEYNQSLTKYGNAKKAIRENEELLKNKETELIGQKSSIDENLKKLLDEKTRLEKLIEEALKNDPANPPQDLYTQLEEIENGIKDLAQKLSLIEKALLDINEKFMEVEVNKKNLKSQAELLEKNAELLESKKKELDAAKVLLDAGKEEYQKGLDKYISGFKTFEEENKKAKSQLDAGKKKLDDGEKAYKDGLAQVEAAKKSLSQNKLTGQDELNKAKEKLIKGQDDYNKGLIEFNKENEKAIKNIEEGKKKIKDAKDDLESLTVPAYIIGGKHSMAAYFAYMEQADGINNLSYIFSAMFYAVAILVTLTTILRMVDTERTQIGTLKALGYSNFAIRSKYLLYGLSAGFLGTVLGTVLGFFFIRPPIFNAYSAQVTLTSPDIFNPIYVLVAFMLSFIIIAATIFFSTKASLGENAANLMRPKTPKASRRILLEKIPFIWKKLSFLAKVAIRNILKSKLRFIMTIIGVAGSFGLIAMGSGIRSSVNGITDKQFGSVYRYDLMIFYDADAKDFSQLKSHVQKNSKSILNAITNMVSINNKDGLSESVTILATDEVKKIDEFIRLKKRGNNKIYELKDDGAIISERLATAAGVSKGQYINFKDNKGLVHSIKVLEICEQYYGHQMYMTKEAYKKLIDKKADINSYYIIAENSKDIDSFARTLEEYEAVQKSVPISDLKDSLDNLVNSLGTVVFVIILVSSLLTFVVLYNLTNINISERIREISTIKVLGFRQGEVISYVFREIYLQTALGIFFGIWAGKSMHSIIVFTLSPSQILLDPQMNIFSFIFAFLIVTAFTILVMLLAKRNMSKIDMVTSLKSVE